MVKFNASDVPEEAKGIKSFWDRLTDEEKDYIADAWHAFEVGEYKGSMVHLARYVKQELDLKIGAGYLADWMTEKHDVLSRRREQKQ